MTIFMALQSHMRYNKSAPAMLITSQGAAKLIRSLTMQSIPHAPGVYQILCVPTGKIYVGSSVDLAERWLGHQSVLRRGARGSTLLQHAWNKYGPDAFEFSVLECVLLVEMLIEREQYWLDRLRPYDRDRGLNVRHIAENNLGMSHSQETRQKISKKLTGRTIPREVVERMAAGHRGKPQPREAVERLRAINKTKVRTPEMRAHWARVLKERGLQPSDADRALAVEVKSKWYVVTNASGESRLIKNLRAFCREEGLYHSGPYRVAHGILPSYRGWKVRYATEEEITSGLLVPA